MLFPTPQFAMFMLAVLLALGVAELLVVERRPRSRAVILSFFGLVFYSTLGEVPLFVLLLVSAGALAVEGVFSAAFASGEPPSARTTVLFCMALASPLLFLKYSRFMILSVSALIEPAEGVSDSLAAWVYMIPQAPPGISFFTFSAIALACRHHLAARSGSSAPVLPVEEKIAFLLFFPCVLSGPLWRPEPFSSFLREPAPGPLPKAAAEFMLGFFLKLVVAGWAGSLVDPAFSHPESFSPSALWGASFAYSIQLYADFAGYSLMAIGIARAMGFSVPANFNAPYFAVNLQDFWRRWHITLGAWFRDFIFIPLGGSKARPAAVAINAFVVMAVSGVWHGAGWTFVIWGAAHGLVLAFLAFSKASPASSFAFWEAWRKWGRTPQQRAVSGAATLFFVILCWIPFRAADMATTMSFFKTMSCPSCQGSTWSFPAWVTLALLTGAVLLEHLFSSKIIAMASAPWRVHRLAFASFAAFALILEISPPGLPNFIYFQF